MQLSNKSLQFMKQAAVFFQFEQTVLGIDVFFISL